MRPPDLERLAWPVERLGEAVELLAREGRICRHPARLGPPPAAVATDSARLGRWLNAAALRLGAEVEPVRGPYHELAALLTAGGPLLVRLRGDGPPRFLLVVSGSRSRVRLLDPETGTRWATVEAVRSALCGGAQATVLQRVDRLLDGVGVGGRRRARAQGALLAEQLEGLQVGDCWLLRLHPGAPFLRQLRQAGLLWRLLAIVCCHVAQVVLLAAAWWMIGRGALSGIVDQGLLTGWAMLLLTMVPLSLLTVWQQGRFVIGCGALLKRRLLVGVLRTDPEEMRSQGAGQLLGRVLESAAVEALVLGGGYLAVLALVELMLSLLVLAAGAAGLAHGVLLLGWTAVTGGLAWRVFRARERWTDARLELTNDLVERMVGHRTRLAQQPPELWHEGEDTLLASYLEASRRVDLLGPIVAASPAGWQLVGLAGLAVPFVTGGSSPAGLAIGLGGVILGGRALSRFVDGLNALAGAAIAWRRVAPIYHAASELPLRGTPEEPVTSGEIVIEARDVTFSYPDRPRPALSSLDLCLRRGEQLLLVGPSGGGKSTLAMLLAGLQRPRSGLLLLDGLDRETVGEERWHSLVSTAPQLQENHVLTETFSFNLLMGRGWPPSAPDLAEADAVCRELGLGELLERMPAGLQQTVGDTGWQLSHGERGRLFLARSLLQGADLVVLDESFAALDPENLQRAVECARKRASTLLVIAHP